MYLAWKCAPDQIEIFWKTFVKYISIFSLYIVTLWIIWDMVRIYVSAYHTRNLILIPFSIPPQSIRSTTILDFVKFNHIEINDKWNSFSIFLSLSPGFGWCSWKYYICLWQRIFIRCTLYGSAQVLTTGNLSFFVVQCLWHSNIFRQNFEIFRRLIFYKW